MSNNTLNATFPGVIEKAQTSLIIECVVCIVIMLCILFGNSLVCIAFKTDRKLQTTTNCFIVTLACSDLMVGIVVIPLYIFIQLSVVLNTDALFRVWMALEIVACSSSIVTLTMISLERCISVTFPAIHRNISRRWVYGCIVFIWVYSIFASGALMDVYAGPRHENWKTIYKSVVPFFLPLLVIIIAYAIIFKVAIMRLRRHNNKLSREIRIAITISIVIGVFICCWMPFFVLFLVVIFAKSTIHPIGFTIAKFLQYGNSVFNPIIYTYSNQDFRKSFMRLLSCFFKAQRRRLESTLVTDRSRAHSFVTDRNRTNSQLESRTETTTLQTTPL